MIIRCGNCGFLRYVKHKGSAEEIEAGIDKAVQEGWRYVRIYDGYKCPNCEEDPLYEAAVGKIKKSSRNETYKSLLNDVSYFLRMLI